MDRLHPTLTGAGRENWHVQCIGTFCQQGEKLCLHFTLVYNLSHFSHWKMQGTAGGPGSLLTKIHAAAQIWQIWHDNLQQLSSSRQKNSARLKLTTQNHRRFYCLIKKYQNLRKENFFRRHFMIKWFLDIFLLHTLKGQWLQLVK